MSTKSLLDELESLGATGNAKPLQKELKFSTDRTSDIWHHPTAPPVVEGRAEKMVKIADIVVDELGVLIDAATRMREALLEMKTVWSGQEVEEDSYANTDEEGADDELAELGEEAEDDEPEEEDVSIEDVYDRPINAVAVFVPEPVPLPPDVATLED